MSYSENILEPSIHLLVLLLNLLGPIKFVYAKLTSSALNGETRIEAHISPSDKIRRPY